MPQACFDMPTDTNVHYLADFRPIVTRPHSAPVLHRNRGLGGDDTPAETIIRMAILVVTGAIVVFAAHML